MLPQEFDGMTGAELDTVLSFVEAIKATRDLIKSSGALQVRQRMCS